MDGPKKMFLETVPPTPLAQDLDDRPLPPPLSEGRIRHWGISPRALNALTEER